jgi:hypothetical protein
MDTFILQQCMQRVFRDVFRARRQAHQDGVQF